jgi:probable poly-beta-1,6-N-acetyl-D-glucosamine export protein
MNDRPDEQVNRSRWMTEFDYLRGFAIVAIISIHVLAFSTLIDHPNSISPVTGYLTHLADFGVPLFLFISGFMLSARYIGRTSARQFYQRRMQSILLPYLFFALVFAVFNWFVLGQTSTSQQVIDFLLFYGTGPFWFVAVILQLYLLFPLLVKVYNWAEASGRAEAMVVVSLALYVLWYGVVNGMLVGILENNLGASAIYAEHVIGMLFFPFLLFFVAGMYVDRNRNKIARWLPRLSSWLAVIPVLLLALVLQLFGTGFLWSLVLLPFALLMGALLYRLSIGLRTRKNLVVRTIQITGLYSFGLFLVHMLAISAVANRLYALGLGVEDPLFYVLLLPGTIALSVIAIYVLGRLPFGRYLSGIKSGPPKSSETRAKRARLRLWSRN